MQKKVKVLYLITKGSFGGAQRYVFDLATALPKDRFDVAVAFGEGDTLGEKLTKKGIRTVRLENARRDIGFGRELKLFFELRRLFKKERPDVVHLNSSKIGFVGALAARLYNLTAGSYKVKAIFTAHGWAFNEKRSWFVRIAFFKLHWLTVLLSHKTIAVSEKTKKDITRFPFLKGKVIVIRNGIKEPDFEEGFVARQKLAPHVEKNTWIGTISELHPNKGLDYAIGAFGKIADEYPDTAFLIIGEGEQRETLQELIKEKGLEHQVFLLGYVQEAERYLKAFDIFTLTSRTEAFPYVLLEAGFAGLPTIASEVGGIPEIIEHNRSGLLTEAGNMKEIAAALQELLIDPVRRAELGKEFRLDVSHDLSFEAMTSSTFSLYF